MKQKILIIENPLILGKTLAEILGRFNMITFYTKNEEETIEVLNKEKPEVIMIEPVLPHNFLTDAKKTIRGSEYIGVGLYILEKIEEIIKNFTKTPRIFIYTVASLAILEKDGFQISKLEDRSNYRYKRKPYAIDDILMEIILEEIEL